jgi:hypothetical protein
MSFLQCTGTVAVLLWNLHSSLQETILFFSLKRCVFSEDVVDDISEAPFLFSKICFSSLVQLPCLIANTEFLDCNYFNAESAAQCSEE